MAVPLCGIAALAIVLFGLALLAGCSQKSQRLMLAPNIDLDRNAGRWNVIANIPYFIEDGKVGSYFGLVFQPGGKLTDVYSAHARTFDTPLNSFAMSGYVVPGTGNAQSLLRRLNEQSFDISQFRRVPQTPAQIGNPGFQ
jgi:apolipoprotein D and lipocalin family protein